MSRSQRFQLLLTERALTDIEAIFAYSVEQWGKRTADRYLDDLEAGLQRIQEQPGLLKAEADLHPALQFYRVNQHLLACDVRPKAIIVLTVIHSSMDIPARLAELQPTLVAEVELLHRKLEAKRH